MSTDDKNKLVTSITDDSLLDDIEDMPGFVVFPSGAYLVTLEKGIDTKEINDKPYFEAAMTLDEVVEMSEKLGEEETAPKPGDIGSVLFNKTNKFAMGNFKEFVKPIAERFSVRTVGEIITASKGIQLLIIVRRKKNKDKEGNEHWNMNVKKTSIL